MKAAHQVTPNARFGRWTVIRFDGFSKAERALWLCRCDCGTERPVLEHNLYYGSSTSCGCKGKITHGEAFRSKNTPEYRTWISMLQRCLNPHHSSYAYYGGRGITVCDRWLNDFNAFLSDMGRRPSKHHSLDRIDNDAGYSPENCRWTTEQQRNRRDTFMINGVPVATLAQEYNISRHVLRARILWGWNLKDALTKPVRARKRHSP